MGMKRVLGWLTLLCVLVMAMGTVGPAALAASKYTITVDITNQIVTVYKNGNTTEAGIVRQMICSTGKSGTATPTGTYSLPSKRYSSERREWYYFPKYNCYAKWATRIVGGILFHSVLFTASKSGPTRSSVNALGSKASHGCVRLRVDDAKWIAQNCPAGTRCRIFKSGKANASLRRRLLSRSFSRSKETYDHFMGRTSEGAEGLLLEKGSAGTKVKQLQRRLKALGFLDDTVDGKFGSKTRTAVKRFQAAADRSQTGKVDDSLWTAIFADGAPTGTWVTLARGMSGPAVKVLQQALEDLKLYASGVDGSFGSGTAQAVRDYQDFFGYAVNGRADRALQESIIKQAADVKGRYGDGEYQLVKSDRSVNMARLKKAVKLYAKARTSAKKLATLKKKTEVEVIARVGAWSKVRYNGQKGYLQNKYLTFFKGSKTVVTYEGVEPAEPTPTPEIAIPTPTPSPTPEIFIPTPSPSPTPEVFIPTPSPSPTPEIFIPAA